MVQELKHRSVGIWDVVVGVDARVRMAGERFGIAGVREVEAVGNARDGALVFVTEDGSLRREERPEERHELGTALLRGGGEELLLEVCDIAAGVVAVWR